MLRRLAMLIVTIGVLGLLVGCSRNESENHRGDRDDERHEAREVEKHHAKVSPAVLDQGRNLYKTYCVACHGESGRGDGPAAGVMKPPPRDHTDSAYMSTLPDKQIADIIKMGGALKGKPLMPSHPQFKEAQLAALVAYVRSLSKPQN